MSFYFCICSPSRQRRGGILATPVRKEKREKEKGRCILVTSVAQEKEKKENK